MQSSNQKRNALVFYSLGNLVFGGTHDMKTFDAVLACMTLHFSDDKVLLSADISLFPVETSGNIPQNNFQPVFAQGKDAERILSLIQADTEPQIDSIIWPK